MIILISLFHFFVQAKEMKDVNGKLKKLEELRRQNDETISHLKSLLTTTVGSGIAVLR